MAAPIALAPLRVACPSCGGAIHPVASRCRHCRRDLARHADAPRPPVPAAAPRRSPLRPRFVFIAALMVVVAAALAVPLGVS
jgi:hypothetical protein